MSNYVKTTNFTAKDSLPTGDPDKVVRGAEFDVEFNAIQVAIDSKADSSADGDNFLTEETDPTVPAHVKGITQENIDFWNAGGSASDWDDLTGKPTEFPPSVHTHEIAEINGLQDALDNAGEIEEAPEDGVQYARQNAAWTPVSASGSITYTLPVTLRSGGAQLPLTVDGTKLAVMTRGGELQLPLAA